MDAPSSLRFDDVMLDPEALRLVKADQPRRMTPLAFDVLLFLIRNRGILIDRQKLLDHAWKGAFVTDNAISRVIKEIRQAIGDDAATPRYIETVPRRGYRFIAPVEKAGGLAPAPLSIAVLPFTVRDGELDYLGDGMATGIINTLARLPRLRVIARSTAFRYKTDVLPLTAGRELGVAAVLTGDIGIENENAKVAVEIMSTSDGSHLWGRRYTRPFAAIALLQDEIVRDVIEGLPIETSPSDRVALARRDTDSSEAYRLYLKGYYWLYKFSPEGLTKAFEFFQKAIESDPRYAMAYAGLVEAYFNLSFFTAPREVWPKAKEAALTALQIDGALAEAHYAMALVSICWDRDWITAETEFRKALEIKPGYAYAHDWYGWTLGMCGRFSEGLSHLRAALEIDPLSLTVGTDYGSCLYWAGRYSEAAEALQGVVDLESAFFIARVFLGLTWLQMGNVARALAELRMAAQSGHPGAIGFLGYVCGRAGLRDEAEELLRDLTAKQGGGFIPADAFALIQLGLGQTDAALESLRQACDERSVLTLSLPVDPVFDELRADPRFEDLLRRLNVPRNVSN